MTQDSQDERRPGQVFLMRSTAGHWMYEIRDENDQSRGFGAGFEDQFDALEAAQEHRPELDLNVVISTEVGYMVKSKKASE